MNAFYNIFLLQKRSLSEFLKLEKKLQKHLCKAGRPELAHNKSSQEIPAYHTIIPNKKNGLLLTQCQQLCGRVSAEQQCNRKDQMISSENQRLWSSLS